MPISGTRANARVMEDGERVMVAHEPVSTDIMLNYPGMVDWNFGKHYILPKPTDPRLCERVAVAVARAAIATKVAAISGV